MTAVLAARSLIRTHTWAYSCLALLFVISVIQCARDTRDRVDEILYGDQFVYGPFDLDEITFAVAGIEPSAEAAGLRKGDILLSVDGRQVNGFTDYEGAVRRARFGDTLRFHVRSGSIEKDVFIKPNRFTYLGFVKGESTAYPYIVLLRIAIPLFCMAIGFWVAAVRVHDGAAWQLLLLMLSVGNTIRDSRTTFGNEDALQPFLTAFTYGFAGLSTTALALFGIVFPERLAIDRRFPWIKWLIVGPLIVGAVVTAIGVAVAMHHHSLSLKLWPIIHWLQKLATYLNPAALLIFFASLGYKTVTASSRDSRRRLLFLDAGVVVSILPFLVLVILSVTHDVPFKGWSAVIPIVMLLIFPLTMAYVIVVHRAMDVRVAIRQGVRYLLATGAVRVLQVLVSVAIIVVAANLSNDSSVTRRVIFIALGFILLGRLRGFVQRLCGWIDRRFFREAYNAEHVLSELSEEVRSVVKRDTLTEMVCRRISESLHVPRLAMLLRNGAFYETAYALGYADGFETKFPSDGPVPLRLEQLREPQTLYLDDPQSWVNAELNGHADRTRLQELQSQVLLPLESRERLVGFISLGAKQSEEPYNAADLRLLRSVAAQTGLALENSRLTAEVATETAQRERLNRELEIAREVQQRLFPQKTPQIEGVQLAGACRPALSVGGDYYDYLSLANGELAFAVGDVSGKGIPAAILMAVLQTSVRGQAMTQPEDLAALTRIVNLQLTESSPKSHFATLFYAQYDAQSRVLRYVNAGHNPPLLIRAEGETIWLRSTGVAVGWSKRSNFTESQAALEPGDVLFVYTDGFTEAMNAARDEYGEERFERSAQLARHLHPQAILPAMMQAVDEFTADAAQNDDMTLVVVKVL